MGTNTGVGIGIGIPFKNNALGGDRPYLPPELKARMIGVWDNYGKKNTDADRNIIKNKIPNAGGDLEILNAAYKLNSGFGKYKEDFTSWRIYPNIEVTDNVITTNGNFNLTWFIYKHSSESKINEMNIKVSGIPKGGKILYFYISDETANLPIAYTIPKDGIYHLPESKINNNRVSVGFTVESRYDWNNIRIEQIPSFEGAFVTDGIDDLITSTKTVQEMGITDEITVVSMIHKISSDNNWTNLIGELKEDHTFVANRATNTDKTGIYGYTYNYVGDAIVINNILGDKNDYIVKTSTSLGLDNKYYVTGFRSAGIIQNISQIAWYWTFIANRVLTTDEINQVIAYYNLDRTLNPDILCNTIKQGITNENHAEFGDKLIDYSGNGRDIQLNNIAWNKESGIDDDGALCLDGVNDFGKVTGMPIYKDYTIVVDYERISGIEQAWAEALISKSYIANQGAFVLMETNGMAKHSYSFGGYTTFNKDDSTRTLLYQSKYKCGDVDLNVGTGIDGDTLWLGTYRDNYSSFFNGVIYSLMSFPYSMSEFLIERQLKKHKLGTLYPDMVEFRPVIKSNASYDSIVFYYKNEKVENGTYLTVGSSIGMHIRLSSSPVNEIKSITVNGIPATFKYHDANNNIYQYDFNLTSKSPQKINITIDEYIRFEDIVQPYPVLLRFKDENGNEVSWGGKFKVGSTITRIGSAADSNLLPNIYNIFGLLLNGNQVTSSKAIVEKTMVFKAKSAYIFDNNEPNCILSPRLLSIPNSSYKILGYIPDISGNGNHGVIHNSAYAEGSGVNEDGSYQFDGVDDFVTIPTLSSGGKQVLMKVNSRKSDCYLYDQRNNWTQYLGIVSTKDFMAYNYSNQRGKTYIDGILNENITANDLIDITHNITVTNNRDDVKQYSPCIGTSFARNSFAQMALYDFMLFDKISTEDKIKELNEYVGIEAKVELPPYYWDAYGKTNLDADKATIQQRGVAVGDYDLTNTNFAYDKMSGFGGYEFEKFTYTTKWIETKREDGIEVIEKNDYSFTAKKVGTGQYFWDFKNNSIKTLDRDLTVKAISNNNVYIRWEFKYRTAEKPDIDSAIILLRQAMTPNVPITVTLPYKTQEEQTELGVVEGSAYYLFYFDPSDIPVGEEYTVEMLPLYPNGLLYDGVTDYSKNANIPALDDFTAIIKREWLKKQGCPLIKGSKVYEGGNGNALLLEWDKAYNFVFYKRTDIMEGELPDNISFITPTNYNGNVITRGSEQDTNGICIAGDGNAGFANMVFYKLILYPKTIPLLQINFLKNLMERDEIIDLNNPIFIKNE